MSDDLSRATDRTVGAALRARRTELRLSQSDLAEAVGVTHQQVSKYEEGRDRLTVGRLVLAARFLCRPVEWFFDPDNATARLRRHCALLPLERLLPGFAGEGLQARVLFDSDAEAPWPGLVIVTVALADAAAPRAPQALPRALYPAVLRHGEAALLAIAAADGAAPHPDAGPRAGAALN